jgi:hypothetical protein
MITQRLRIKAGSTVFTLEFTETSATILSYEGTRRFVKNIQQLQVDKQIVLDMYVLPEAYRDGVRQSRMYTIDVVEWIISEKVYNKV